MIIVLDPFGLATSYNSATTNVLNRLYSPYYNAQAQDEITVVLIDQQYLQNTQQTWPISYQNQARIFKKILNYQPKALFIDIIYRTDRSTETDHLNYVFNTLERYKKANNVAIHLAKVDQPNSRTPQQQLQNFEQSVITWQGYGDKYPVTFEQQNSAAFNLYQAYCKGQKCDTDKDKFNAPLAIQWGIKAKVPELLPSATNECNLGYTSFEHLLNIVSSDVFWRFQPQTFQKCPYAITLPALTLEANTAQARQLLEQRIKNKLVLVGVMASSAPDISLSPIHGQIAGVYVHAMALDNLLTYGTDYPRQPPKLFAQNINIIDVFELMFILWLFVLGYRADNLSKRRYQPTFVAKLNHLPFVILMSLLILVLLAFITSEILHYEPINWLGIIALSIPIFLLTVDLSGLSQRALKLIQKARVYVRISQRRQLKTQQTDLPDNK